MNAPASSLLIVATLAALAVLIALAARVGAEHQCAYYAAHNPAHYATTCTSPRSLP